MYATRLLELAEDAYVYRPEELPIIERQLIGCFTDGLAHGYLRLKVMRDNPTSFQTAVNLALGEQNLRTRYNLRSGESFNCQSSSQQVNTGSEPMEIDHLRPKTSCTYCRKIGHKAADCRKRQREINAYTVTDKTNYARGGRTDQANWQKNRDCWKCGRLGHVRRNCKFPSQQQSQNSFRKQEN